MAFAPLILQGNKLIGPGNAGAAVNVDDQIIDFTINAVRQAVEVPATYGKRKTYAAGDDTYTITIRYLQDNDPTAVVTVLWTALADATGTINFKATFRDGAVSSTNQQWQGIAVVTGDQIGGTVNSAGVSSMTFPLVDRPTLVGV